MSEGSQEGGADSDGHQEGSPDPPTPTRHPRRAQKAGSRLTSMGDDTLRFFQVVEGKKQCKFCL